MPNIRFAQLSFWFGHAHGICNAAQKHDSVDLSAIWDADAKRGQTAADHFGVEFIPDLDELLAAMTSMPSALPRNPASR